MQYKDVIRIVAGAIGLALAGVAQTMAGTVWTDMTVGTGATSGGNNGWWNNVASTVNGYKAADNKVQYTGGAAAVSSQSWDLEAMLLDGAGNNLGIVGGYNPTTGNGDSGANTATGVANGQWFMPGDIFINTGPVSVPSHAGSGYWNSTGNDGYHYVIHFSFSAPLSGGSAGSDASGINNGESYTIYDISNDPNTQLRSVWYSQFNNASPWRYLSGGTAVASGTVHLASFNTGDTTYAGTALAGGTFKLLNGAPETFNPLDDTGSNAAPGNSTAAPNSTYGWATSNKHYVLEVNLGSLSLNNFDGHVTFGCGNDLLAGQFGSGAQLVPDSGLTLSLLGLGLSGLVLVARRRGKSS